MRLRARTIISMITGAVAAVAISAVGVNSSASAATPTWAPASTATLHPGVMAYTAGAQCTVNFVYTDGAGNVYLGYAAHCAGTGTSTDTNGCSTGSLPIGTPVTFSNDGSLVSNGTTVGTGTLAYSSWLAMKNAGETDANTCAYNDLALVKVDPQYVADVNPTVPFYGGPNALGTGTAAGDKIYSYGNSSLRAGVSQLSPKIGVSLGDSAGGWTTSLYTVTPGIPGDSGSGFMDANGNAFGVLSTVALAPLAGSNGVGNLRKELAYANSHGMSGVAVSPGTSPFAPPA
jgi:hypothetical protein